MNAVERTFPCRFHSLKHIHTLSHHTHVYAHAHVRTHTPTPTPTPTPAPTPTHTPAPTLTPTPTSTRKVPCSKQTLLLNKSVPAREKRLLMKFLQFCTSEATADEGGGGGEEPHGAAAAATASIPETGFLQCVRLTPCIDASGSTCQSWRVSM
jgi:hypothetical protein